MSQVRRSVDACAQRIARGTESIGPMPSYNELERPHAEITSEINRIQEARRNLAAAEIHALLLELGVVVQAEEVARA